MIYASLSELSAGDRGALMVRSAATNPDTLAIAEAIVADVRGRGDAALVEYSARFDGVVPGSFIVDAPAIDAAMRGLGTATRDALAVAVRNVRAVHAAQRRAEPAVETMPGVVCWREARAIRSVGLYVPAGSAPLLSTVVMLGVPALLAGVPNIVLCTPPTPGGGAHPAILAAAGLVGLRDIRVVGGAQAIAAMAYGTESVPSVEKIFGPGNRWVAAAKQIVAADAEGAAVDVVAGPSELLVIADDSANPEVVAADLAAQAEHDPDAHVVLVTTSAALASAVAEALPRVAASLPRKDIIQQALGQAAILVASSIEQAVAFSNEYAPEHLQLLVRDAERIVPAITCAGSVFVGPTTPVTAGDYASGTNHTLPTGGAARRQGGVALESFQTMISFQRIEPHGLLGLAPALGALARAEGLEGHASAVDVRVEAPGGIGGAV